MTATALVSAARVSRSPRPQSQPRLRLTRRGRAVVTALVTVFVLGLALTFTLIGGTATATSDLSSGSFEYVTVQSGQSLWQLAESMAPAADPREVISELVRLNQLQTSVLQPGDRIAIPVNYTR